MHIHASVCVSACIVQLFSGMRCLLDNMRVKVLMI